MVAIRSPYAMGKEAPIFIRSGLETYCHEFAHRPMRAVGAVAHLLIALAPFFLATAAGQQIDVNRTLPRFPVTPAQWTETVPAPPTMPSATPQPQFTPPFFPTPQSEPFATQPFATQPSQPRSPLGVSPSVGPFVGAETVAPAPQFIPEYAPRRIQLRARNLSSPPQVQMQPSESGDETVFLITNGINVIIDGIDQLGTVDLVADRVVIWTGGGLSSLNLSGVTETASGQPFEMYLEGNIEFRQGDRLIHANSMYYNAAQQTGVVLGAELLTSVPRYEGLVRLKADVLRQINSGSFQAFNAALTTSRLGMPRYWFQSENMTFDQRLVPQVDPLTGQYVIDPQTGQPVANVERLATSQSNFAYLGGIPIFYWPSFKTDFASPGFYVDSIKLGNDRVFGTQAKVDFDLGQVFGLTYGPGTKWTGSVDYLSERGWGFGTNYRYASDRFFALAGPSAGVFDAWAIDDQGLDNLGADRRALTPEEDFRYRVLWQHRQRLQYGWQLTGEIGLISDRNFLEQYYEREWDQWKDQTTGFQLKRVVDNSSWNVTTELRLNDFFTQTQWLPKLDHYLIGQPMFGNRLTWSSHSSAGYARLETADPPVDLIDAGKFNRLAWEMESSGVRIGTRNEVAMPLNFGASKLVPYLLGDVMHWGEVLDGDDLTRLYGQAGVRWSLPMWRVDPSRRSTLFNVNGIAHKVVLDSEFFYADANQNIDQFPLYDPLDDDAVEHFRRRFIDDTFGGVAFVDEDVPLKFDERLYALRSGMQRWVTAPVPEIADDLMMFQIGARQRWQTKRGAPGRERIIDWITLDTHATYFPKANRDNFGADVGLLNYDFRWHVGDRFTLMSDGYADVFGDGLRMLTVGGYMGRPERGSLYLGFRSIGGPISSSILVGSFNYRMSQKWLMSAATAIDFGPTGNIGQRFELTRIGESFLVSMGLNLDESRDNVGVGFTIEPRFLPLSRRSLVGGARIPPAGARGLE